MITTITYAEPQEVLTTDLTAGGAPLTIVTPVQSEVLTMLSMGAGPQGPEGDPGVGIAAGGTAGQKLVKASDDDYDTEWVDDESGGGTWGGIGGTLSDQTDLQNALNAKSNTGHTHTASEITDFSSAADARITAQKAQPSGLASLDSGGKVPSSQLPAIAITSTFVVNSQAAQLALVAQEGDVAVRTDQNKSYIHDGGVAGTMADWQELLTPTDAVLSVNGQTGSVSVPGDGSTILGAGTPGDPFRVNYSGVNENEFVFLQSGNLTSSPNIFFSPGQGAIYADDIAFRISWKGDETKYANWDASGLTGAVTIEFQDASGVMAYLSDIPDLSGYLTSAAAASTYVALAGSYSDPSWITSLAWSKISGAPAFITGVNWGGIGGTLASQADLVAALGAKASLTGAETLTNKRITPRVGGTTSSATPTINTDTVDMYILTAQAADITSFTTNLSGTPTDGQKLWISITGTAARAITWGSSFESSTVTLPTTTVLTNRLDVGFVWNAATSKWRCVAKA